MMTYVRVEYHPENSPSPFVVLANMGKARLWFAYRDPDTAVKKIIEWSGRSS